ncbi:DeoR/GlpR family DNA-binding transcription regulator [Specibacter sp. NPDC078692]|uniref:DeoR/GlpR family DNA-binding transcription regulator n=1 Tax=Specibacter sp. NPDC078692 TaxID=3155818 RepID=UPI00343CA8FD
MALTGTLDAESRRTAIAKELLKHGALQLNETAQVWNVHEMTIRRDFDTFVTSGLARRVRGGIVALGGDSFTLRKHQNGGAKQRIAEKMLSLIMPGAAIALDSSTTVHALAESLSGLTGVSVVTNGLSAFQTLHGREGIRTYLTGGEREEENISLVGSLAVLSVQQFTLDICFLSSMSLDTTFGTSELTLEQVAVKKAMVEASQLSVLAVDSSKFETRARFRSLPLSGFDVLITELDPNDEHLDAYREQVPTII